MSRRRRRGEKTPENELRDFFNRIEKKIDLSSLVKEGKIYDYDTLKVALSKVLTRKNEPTDKQIKVFQKYLNLTDRKVRTVEIKGKKIRVVEGHKVEPITFKKRNVIRYVIRDSKGRFVKWVK